MLKTDFYQLTMANGYLKNGLKNKRAVFHFFFRSNPFQGGYAVVSGLEILLKSIERGAFSEDDVHYLSQLKNQAGSPVFDADFLAYLDTFTFSVDVYAIPEGTLVFEYEPLVRIEGSLPECQILETLLSNIINFNTLITTKATRMLTASDYGDLVEFGFRRAQGVDGALSASRAAYIGGFGATSNVEAGKKYNIPLRGTHAHSWVQSFQNEKEAFRAFYNTYPDNCVFLLDTYNSMEGLKNAVAVAKKIQRDENPAFTLTGVRIDSGDLAYLSKAIRHYLDAEGLTDTRIIAGNDLDEYIIKSLREQGARIDTWAVGTKLVTAYDQPSLGGVYKLSCVHHNGQWEDRLKLSEESTKISIPGRLQVQRYYDRNNQPVFDSVYDANIGAPLPGSIIYSPIDSHRQKRVASEYRTKNLLFKVMEKGRIIDDGPPIDLIRKKTIAGIKILDQSVKRFINPHYYPAGLEERLHKKRNALILKLKSVT